MNPTQTLEKILTDYGHTVLQNSRLVESLFKDLCYEPEYKREVNILILALKEDIPQRLLNANPVTEYLKNQLAQKIEDTYSVPVQHGKVAVDTWENALYPNKVKSSNTVPTQPQAPKVQKPVQPATPIAKPQPSTAPTAKPTQQPTTPFISELDQGVWTDPNTGLMWARISAGQEWKNNKCVGDAQWRDWKKALYLFRLAGYNDWRLPTIDELKTLMLAGKTGYNPILFKPFTGKYGFYWSSSSTNSQDIQGINFDSNYVQTYDYHRFDGLVRPVRGKAKITLPQPTIQKPVQPVTPIEKPIQPQITQPINELDQGVWTDPNTGLMWARISIGQEWKNGQCVGDAKKLNWEDAKKECQNFQLAGFNDWRLPTIDELKTLMIKGTIILFQSKEDYLKWYWSSSPYIGNTNKDSVWGKDFISMPNTYNKNSYQFVRTVRNSR